MEKKLPKVFANTIDKELKNNEKVYVASSEAVEEEKRSEKTLLSDRNINQKIRKIFNSKNYIYKATVEITQNNSKFEKKIIGKNGDNLITIDNEIIPIDTITDIKLVD